MTSQRLPPATFKPSRFNFWASLALSRNLLLNGRTGALYELTDEERALAIELFEEAGRTSVSGAGKLPAALEAGGFLVASSIDEVESLVTANESECAAHATLEVTVVPTYECNLRCTYCYVDFRKGRMTTLVEAAVARYVERSLPLFEEL